MTRPGEDIATCRRAHARLVDAIAGIDDATARQPSRLPDWSIGHVLTHIARNADSVVRRLAGAMRDEVVDQYPGGYKGRTAEIEAGAGRAASELVDDVMAANDAVEAAFEAMPDEAWDRLGRGVGGEVGPVRNLAFARFREVEVHHVDLGLGYEWTDWPDGLVERWLPSLLDGLPGRTDQRHLVAWLLRRAGSPELAPW